MVKRTGLRIQESEFGGAHIMLIHNSKLAIYGFLLMAACIVLPSAFAQQPQAQAGQAIYPVNAKYVQGFGPGYWPTAGTGLNLNLAPGTAVCSNIVRTYAGGTLTLAPSATNYVYLNTSNNCAPASNTTGFTGAAIPIATAITTSTTISSITDVRTPFVSTGVAIPGTVTSVGMTGDGIIFSPTVSGSPVTSSGTLSPQLLTQTANTLFAGPGSGPAATPTFRNLAAADLPATIASNTTGNAATASAFASSPTQCGTNNWATGVSSSGNANCSQPAFSNISGTVTVLQGGTGQTTVSAAFNALSPLATEGDLPYYHSSSNTRLGIGGTNAFLTSNGTDPSWGPLTGAGFGSQTANTFLAAPNGSSGNPSFRTLVGADIPTITISGGGTGQTTAASAFNALSPLNTEGDLPYYHSSANTRLGIGSNGQCLTSNGTDPVWGTCSSGGVTSLSGDGNLITNSGSTGAVTLTPGSFSAHYFWGNNTGSSATAAKYLIGTSDTSVNWYAAGGGTAQAQTVTLTPAATALTAGLTVRWKPTAANTGSGPTLAVSSLAATTITKCGTTALVANDLTTSNVATAVYDGVEFQLLNPMAGACAGSSGVSSFTGDGSLLSNSGSTGVVTATLANAAANSYWGNNTGSSAGPGYKSIGTSDTSTHWYAAGGGVAQAQTVALTPAATSLTAGLTVRWKPTAANTGSGPTLAVNGLTATTITKCGTTALVANDLTTANIATAIYDGTEFQLLNPMAAGCGGGGNLSSSGSPAQYQIGVFASGSTIGGISPSATSGVPLISQGSSSNPTFGTTGIAGGGTGQTTATAAFNALSPLTTEGDLHYYHSSSNARLGIGSNGQCLTSNGTDPVWGSCSTGSGTVTSVGLSMPSIFSVSGSPVTGSGTLTASLTNQSAHLVLAGPSSGSAAPTFRALAGADLPAPSASTLGGVESITCTGGQFLNQISTSGVPACVTGGGGSGLGNGTSVIDASLQAGTDFGSKVNSAFAACTSSVCIVDARGLIGSQTMSTNIVVPANGELILPAATITRSTGVQFQLSNYAHVHGETIDGTQIVSANTTNDYTPVFQPASGGGGYDEIDHVWIGATSSPGLISSPFTVTGVGVPNGSGYSIYTGSFPTCGANACVGYQFGVFGSGSNPLANPNNEGYFNTVASTTTTLTLVNPQAGLETATTGKATQMGGWGIWGVWLGSSFHDIQMYGTDLGISLSDSGCTCYNRLSNMSLNTVHGALYVGADANSNNFQNILAWAGDQSSEGFTNATGYGVRLKSDYGNEFRGLDIENTAYSIVIGASSYGNTFTNLVYENDPADASNVAGESALPTIRYGAINNKIDSPIDVIDQSGNSTNIYGSADSRYPVKNPQGSFQVFGLGPVTAQASAYGTAGTGATYTYAIVAVDFNGNKTLPSNTVTVTNGTLGSTYVNAIEASTLNPGAKCFDVLKEISTTWYSLATCLPADMFPFLDNGVATSSYTLPSRDATADETHNGYVTLNNFPTDGSGGTIICLDSSLRIATGCYTPLTIQTNSSNNSSQTTLNFETSTANAVGLTVTPYNPSGAVQTFEITGGSYTGNASTATALASAPSQCSGNNWSTGIATSGNANCSQPGFNNLSGNVAASQLPNPTSSTLGGIKSLAAVSHQWINQISTSGIPSATQPASTDLSDISTLAAYTATALASAPSQCSGNNWATGIAASGNANCSQVAFSNLSGSASAAQLPNPGASSLGGVESLAAVSHRWINTISTSGVPGATQPACGDLSDAVTTCNTLPTLASTIASASHKWLNSYTSTTGLFTQTQPASSDLSDFGSMTGALFGSQTANCLFAAPNGSTGNMTCRALVGADVPTPTASANGAIPIALFGTSGYGAGTAEMTAVAQNSVKGFSVYLGPDYIEASNLVYDVTTADNTANVYDLGLYGPGCNAGATSVPLVAHTGPTAGTTLAPSTGVKKIAFSASNVIFAPGWYCFAVTSSAASPALILGGSGQASGMPIVYFTAGASIAGTTTSGTLNSTATAPATSVGFNGPANAFMQIYQ